ncbi:hypothetical protein MRX96_057289 [Rhipicephalus microplus]
MQWVDIEVAETREDPMPGEDEYLQIMVRQLQEKLAEMKPRGSTAAAQPQARKTGSTPAACVEPPRQLTTWKPTHTPLIRSDELVIAFKPKITMDLHAALGPGQIGTAVQRFTGSTTNAGISVWPVWDQNIVVVDQFSLVDTYNVIVSCSPKRRRAAPAAFGLPTALTLMKR